MSEPHPFGEWLKRRRKALDLTQVALADEVGCSAATIRKLEDEERRPSVQIVDRLAEIFKIPQEERAAFLRFARGDWKAAPLREAEDAPWLISHTHEPETVGGSAVRSNRNVHLATFLFTDIENSTKLWEMAPEQMKVALERHHAILQEAIPSNGGAVFQIIGDAFCAVFSTVPSAISAVVVAQRQLFQEQWDLPFPIRVRMGIHTGEAEQASDNSLFGGYASNQTLNRVARILSAAHGGQILLSLATKDLIQGALPADTKLRDMGEHHLRNLSRPEHLFQLDVTGLPSDFPPLTTLTHRHNLPIQLTSFIAREQEIALVHRYLLNDDIRLVTLLGPPGIGKTRLSIEAARRSLPDFPDGVFFVALAPLEDPGLIALAVAQALGYVETGNISTDQQLKEGIGDKKILVVLDNCEHLIEGVALLTSGLLSACFRLKILATSRESLRIPGEWLYPVPAFDFPGENVSVDMETVSNFPALTLFSERARAVRPDFALNADNIKTVSAICAHLDGLPLVIELIAARMRLMSPESLLAHLTDQFILSADGMRAVSARQKTLNGAIHWSYKLLSEEEQKLFVYLSVFSGGFSLEAAETMFSDRFEDTPVANLVTSLLDKSLLQRAVGDRAEIRLDMLVTIQQFALKQLRKIGKETEARRRHLDYFLTLAERADQHIHGPHQLEWINTLEAEHDNFRSAFEWSLSANQTEKAVRLFNSIHWAWHVRCHYRELSEWFEEISNVPDIKQFPLQHAKALTNAGSSEWLQGKFAEARSHLTQSRAICMELGPEGEADLAWAFTWLAQVGRVEGTDVAEAAGFVKDGLQLHQKLGNKTGEAFSTLILGAIQNDQKLSSTKQTVAKQTLEHSLELYNQLGDSWGIARTSQGLGVQALNAGDLEKAQTYFGQQLFLDEKLNFKDGIAAALDNLATVHRVRGDFIQARQTFQKSIQIAQEIGLDVGYSLYGLSMTALAENDYESALELFTELFYYERNQYRQIIACDFLMGLSAVSAGLDQPERSAKLYGAAQAIMDTTDYKYSLYDIAQFERHIQLAREKMAENFEALVKEGRAMTMEQAIAYALEKSDE